MSLFGSLQTASNTLQAMQIGLQVVNNNIANANTPGFIREQANFAPAPVQEIGDLTIGLGVQVDSITQVIDEFLGQQVRDAAGDRAGAEIRNDAYKELEQLLGELSEDDLSSAITGFFRSIEDTLNATAGDALSVRNLAVLEGQKLATEIQRIEGRAKEIRDRYDQQVAEAVGQVNQLAEQIADLNVRITQVEGGGAGKSDAGALRAARNQAVSRLTELVDATVKEQPSGGVSVSVAGEFLVFEGQRREVTLETDDGDDETASSLVFTDTGKELQLTSGRVYGLSSARDEIVDGFRESLGQFSSTLIYEFNRVHSQGQGLDGFRTLTSQEGVFDPNASLAEAGLAFPPGNGEFSISLVNADGTTETTRITVGALDSPNAQPASLASVAAQIDAIDGLEASIDTQGRLAIAAQAPNTQFTFSDDTSGFLASVGLNTFFTGSDASNISINNELHGIQNAGKLAMRRANSADPTETGTPGGTSENAVLLAGLIDQPLEALDGASIIERYDQFVNELVQNSTVAGSVAEGLAVFENTLAAEFQAISGVNVDEEAIEMITLQRIYQATARVIATIQEMLDTLIRL